MKKIILVIPVYNEEKDLENSISILYSYMSKNIKSNWRIIIANNASTDKTLEIADILSRKLSRVEAIHLSSKGKGNAIKHAWSKFNSDIYAFCDVDLSTDVKYLKELFEGIIEGYDMVIGSRYLYNSKLKRGILRSIFSKIYLLFIKMLFRTKLTDFQCGFKAINNEIKEDILPKIKNKDWFFDTELLLLVEQAKKYKIKQIPIEWHEDKDSRINISQTSYSLLKNLFKFKKLK